MRSTRPSTLLRGLLIGAVITGMTVSPAAADTDMFSVHGVTSLTTDSETCDTSLEVGFRADIGELPLSNGSLDPATVGPATMLVDGAPALAYSVHTDFDVAPFYFATLELGPMVPGSHELLVVGGSTGVQWRAFNHADPEQPHVAHLSGDYRLGFTVPACGPALPVTISGFAPPVDDAPILNLVRRGDTVPIRFTAMHGTTLLTDPSAFSVSVARAACTRQDPTDRVERLVPRAGAGQLVHDTVSGEFLYRWTAVWGRHPCWDVTFTHASGPSVTAKFRLWGG